MAKKTRRFIKQKIAPKITSAGEYMSPETDPFTILGAIPKGTTYQWVAVAIQGNADAASRVLTQMRAGGWRAVPARRHPKMMHIGNRIEDGGQVLMERSAKLTAKAQEDERQRAIELMKERDAALHSGMPSSALFRHIPVAENHRPFVSDSKKIAQAKEKLFSVKGVYYVDIPLRVAISDHEIEMAVSVLGLEPTEYMRRRVVMNTTALIADDAFTSSDYNFTRDSNPIFHRAEIKAHRLEN